MPEPTKPATDVPAPAADERRATVRIDAAPSGKKFQGVWLELSADQRWVIDYRPRGLWTGFADREVIVTGQCYQPFGQAINSTHFRVEHLRLVTVERGLGPLLEIGPEQILRGTFVEHQFPAGSKLADSPRITFVDDAGTSYWIAGAADDIPAAGTAARIKARAVTPDLSYVAQPGGPNLWILDVRAPDAVDDPDHTPTDIPCPSVPR